MTSRHESTEFLQALLDKRGSVNFPEGEFTIADPLVIYSCTELILSPGTVIRLADDAGCSMLINHVCGAKAYDQQITVRGGIWDGNNVRQKRGKADPAGSSYPLSLMRFSGVKDLAIRDITIKDPAGYAVQIIGADRFTVENITFDFNMFLPNMDGIHVQGKARNGYICNIKGATNDDLVALNCDDVYYDGEKSFISHGDIENITINGLYADHGYTAVRLLSCGSVMRNISITNVFGTYRFYGISFTHHNIDPGAPVWFDGITVDRVFCSKPAQAPLADSRYIDSIDTAYGKGTYDHAIKTAPIIWFAEGISCGNVILANIHRIEEAVTEAPTVQIDPHVDVERLVLANITQRFNNCMQIPAVVNHGHIKKMIKMNID